MERCSICKRKQLLLYNRSGEQLCSICYGSFCTQKSTKSKSKDSKIRMKKEGTRKYYEVTPEDFSRNKLLIKQGLELDIPLKMLGKNFKNQFYRENKPKHSFLKLTPKRCLMCNLLFEGIPCAKYCSKQCRRRAYNANCYKYYKKHMATDWQFALKTRLRDNLRDALRYYAKTGKHRKHQTSNQFINYKKVISQLGPCPGDRHAWHVDHLIPICRFDFSNTEEIKKAFAPENLRWLPAKDNLKKGRYLSKDT